MNAWQLLALAAPLAALVFTAGWSLARRIDNYSLVDALWALAIGLTSWLWLALGPGAEAPRAAAALLVGLWSVRLTWHLQARIRRHHPHEDARYASLRKHWGGREARAFFWFFQAQGVSVIVLALPFLAVASAQSTWSTWHTAGAAVSLLGMLGEALADRQMDTFKRSNPSPGAVCRRGLWAYSRHPNYFFESVTWLGFYLFACGSGWGWATLHAPALILYLLLRVTGIPATEASALARKGEAYRAYQQTTSAFIPLPPRKQPQP